MNSVWLITQNLHFYSSLHGIRAIRLTSHFFFTFLFSATFSQTPCLHQPPNLLSPPTPTPLPLASQQFTISSQSNLPVKITYCGKLRLSPIFVGNTCFSLWMALPPYRNPPSPHHQTVPPRLLSIRSSLNGNFRIRSCLVR